MKLSPKQVDDLVSAFVCQTANGLGTYSLRGVQMRALEGKGLAESFLGSSAAGGSRARHYRLTERGLDLGKQLHDARRR